MEQLKQLKVGDKVRWFYQINKHYKPEVDEIVYVGSEVVGKRVRIDRLINDELIEGGYVNVDELYAP